MIPRRLQDHPTVRAVSQRQELERRGPLEHGWLRRLCLEAGADDVGFVSVEAPALADQRAAMEELMPGARSLVSLVLRMNREPIRSPSRSAANLEFHLATDRTHEVARELVEALGRAGIRAMHPAVGFPMEMQRFPGKAWSLSHKPIAVAAGLGQMGLHRNVIHSRFGNFVLLNTVLLDAEVDRYDQPIDFNPCLTCKLCVAACPVGAISPEGEFHFSACMTHNYREFMGGFVDWVEQLAESDGAAAYRARVPDAETASMWQSLAFGPNYKAAYCMAVCPAGEDVIGPYLRDPKRHLQEVVRPLQEKPEPVYVTAGSDAELHVARRFPHKSIRRVHAGVRPRDVRGFIRALPLVFQKGGAGELSARYHFCFTGADAYEATVRIHDGRIEVQPGLVGSADLRVEVDGEFWLAFLRKEKSVVRGLLTRRLRLRGPPRLLKAFARCFAA